MPVNIVINNVVSRLKEQRNALKRHLGDIGYQARVNGLKPLIQREMKRQDKGPYEIGDWLIKTMQAKRKAKGKAFSRIDGMSIAAAVYELLEEKADARIITAR